APQPHYRCADACHAARRPTSNLRLHKPVADQACCSEYHPEGSALQQAVAAPGLERRRHRRCWQPSVEPPTVSRSTTRHTPDAVSSRTTSHDSPTSTSPLECRCCCAARYPAADVCCATHRRWRAAAYYP